MTEQNGRFTGGAAAGPAEHPQRSHPADAPFPVGMRDKYGSWPRRVGAFLIDFGPTLVAEVVFLIGYGIYLSTLIEAASAEAPTSSPRGAVVTMVIGSILLLAATCWQIRSRWFNAGRTGQSWGKRILKLSLVSEETGGPVGPFNALLRDLVHLLDGFLMLGYLWPLWDEKRQTFSDKLSRTVVIDARPEHS